MNGHKMRSLLVPAMQSRGRPKLFHDAIIHFVSVDSSSQNHLNGRFSCCTKGGKFLATDVDGGHVLRNKKGKPVGYTGQAFILTVPEWALSAKGLAAADEFDGRGKQ